MRLNRIESPRPEQSRATFIWFPYEKGKLSTIAQGAGLLQDLEIHEIKKHNTRSE